MTDARISQVARWLNETDEAVAFTGAGISTESGIPDFRSPGGVWATSRPVLFDEFLRLATARQEYWRQKAAAHEAFAAAQPNVGHRLLARWEQQARLAGVITQNIDGLHQLAGSQRVWELHGTARQVRCLSCGEAFDASPFVAQFLATQQPPVCPACGGHLKHATISFGQQLPADVLAESMELASQVDLFLAIGSSLVVHPAAGLPEIAKRRGARLVILTREPTPLDHLADVVINADIGPSLAAIDAQLTF